MKKIVSLILITLMLFSGLCVYAEKENLSAVGIKESTLDGDVNDFVTRAEFVYLVSKIISDNDYKPVNTKFTDVTEKNPYSGYISNLTSMGIISGVSATEFMPEGKIKKDAVAKILVTILGFDTYAKNNGAYPNGYVKAASELGIFNGVKVADDAYITKADAFNILENSLLAINANKAFPFVKDNENFTIPQSHESIFLTTSLGYSVYRGFVNSVNVKSNTVSITVEKNEYKTNHNILEENSAYTFEVNADINLSHYDKVPVKIWTNEEGVITKIIERSGYNVRYGYIGSVNDDELLTSPYLTAEIESITLLNGGNEFSFDENTKFYYNDVVTSGEVDLSQCFVRLVEKGGVVSYIYVYKMEKGGLITNISGSEKEITYINGENGTKIFNKTKDKNRLLVYIDGRLAQFDEIKTKSVFSYFVLDDFCILAVSERTAVDVFNSYSDKEISLGAFSYKTDSCVYSTNGTDYKKGDIVYELLSGEVKAYFSPDNKVSFVEKSDAKTRFERFYGVVYGVDSPSALETEYPVLLYKLGQNIEKLQYTITEKTQFKDGLSKEILSANAKNTEGEGVYYFTVNGLMEITEVEKCTPFAGYGNDAKTEVSSFTNEIIPMVTMSNGKILYFKDTDIITISEESGDFAVKKVDWLSIYGRGIGGTATLSFYSKEESPQPDVAILCGMIQNMTETQNIFGVVTKKGIELNDKGESVNSVEIMASNGTKQYVVSEETAARLEVNDFVYFAKKLSNEDDQIIISEVIDMSGEMDSFKTSPSKESGLQRSVVRKIDSKRLYLESGSDDIYYMHPYSCFILSHNPNKNDKFSVITSADIYSGENVCYYLVGGEIRAIIVEK